MNWFKEKNTFWPSLINDRDYSFSEHVKHSYQRIKRNIMRKAKLYSKDEMQKEIDSFKSTIENCTCGETALESSMYRIRIPCSHMIFCGAEFPPLPDIDLKLHPYTEWSKSKFEFTVVERSHDHPSITRHAKLKEIAIKNIKRYSHYRKKAEIQEFVEQNFDDEQGYVLGKPIGFYRLTHRGIIHFSHKKASSNDCTTSDASEATDF